MKKLILIHLQENYWNDGEERDDYNEEGVKVKQETKPNIHKRKQMQIFGYNDLEEEEDLLIIKRES